MVSVPRDEDRYCEHRSHGTTVSLRNRVPRMNTFVSKILTQHKSPFQISRVLKSAFQNDIKRQIFTVLFDYLNKKFLYKDKMIHRVKCRKLLDERTGATARIAGKVTSQRENNDVVRMLQLRKCFTYRLNSLVMSGGSSVVTFCQ